MPEDETDEDGDGYSLCVDCDDTDPDINPGTSEALGNGIDDDCVFVVDVSFSEPWGGLCGDGWPLPDVWISNVTLESINHNSGSYDYGHSDYCHF